MFNNSSLNSAKRVLFPSETLPIPPRISVRNSPSDDSPLPFFLLPPHAHDSMDEDEDEAGNVQQTMKSMHTPVREFNSEFKKKRVAEMLE
jgi:hypothetical protein